MKGQGTEIWKKEEYSYEGAHGFIPVMVSYMHEDDKIHPAMIVVPGGGYRQVSRTEAHLVAMDFYEADYNVFVLVYTVNPLDEVPLGMQPLQDISRAIRMIRGKAEEYRITPEKIAVCGFSAGGCPTVQMQRFLLIRSSLQERRHIQDLLSPYSGRTRIRRI